MLFITYMSVYSFAFCVFVFFTHSLFHSLDLFLSLLVNLLHKIYFHLFFFVVHYWF